jgi:hypothetical protein
LKNKTYNKAKAAIAVPILIRDKFFHEGKFIMSFYITEFGGKFTMYLRYYDEKNFILIEFGK